MGCPTILAAQRIIDVTALAHALLHIPRPLPASTPQGPAVALTTAGAMATVVVFLGIEQHLTALATNDPAVTHMVGHACAQVANMIKRLPPV